MRGAAPSLGRVSQLRNTASTTTVTIPAGCIEPEFRAEAESELAEGKRLSEFVVASVRVGVERRRVQAELVAGGVLQIRNLLFFTSSFSVHQKIADAQVYARPGPGA